MLDIVILAAGQGTRMRSQMPKVLHQLAGLPLLQHVLNTAQQLNPNKVAVVYGHGGEKVRATIIAADNVAWVEQKQQLGTGDALKHAMPLLNKKAQVLVLYGDTPLISHHTLEQLINSTSEDEVGLITAEFDNPEGLGRIIRNQKHEVVAIVEQKDATAKQAEITEINTGILLLPEAKLNTWLSRLNTNNAQGEFYLTDIISMAVDENININTITVSHQHEVQGINTRKQLIQLERIHQMMQAENFLEQGVTIIDPKRFDLRGTLECGKDITIDINVIIEGNVTLADNVSIGANVILKDVHIGAGTTILPNSMLEDSEVGQDCIIGPFARLRPGTKLNNNVKVGNFVETKKANVGEGSKLPHLSYIGDAVIGKNVNIGAGTITCNYDGVKKYVTTIGDNVFVGSDTQLIAPVTIGDGAYIGAGSSISKDAPAGKLSIARARQQVVPNWKAPEKE